jgi:hypothetical protein
MFARGQKAAHAGTDTDIESDIASWGTGDNITTTLYIGVDKVATHTQTTQYI